ncbi:hypothetical protein SAMN05660464_0411 [Geodermatophilus dictyosporus]|uniref:Uncharacterized protein n=1 Tax=Geodermatophilus dictyosporus TaxID=1523247 RepID=A0A1I5UWY5_9ACTN|nr:hypothetical protein [Geodermatophilus dictyosporus]SFP99728.1 hypothetical protein SAMN05660464_0411 [Geodermatophilus dictyosporus]
MRSVWSRSRPVLLAAVGALLLTAGSCGGGGEGSQAEESAEVTSAETSSSAASSTGASSGSASDDPAVAQFCTQSAQFEELGNQLGAATPEQLPGLLQQAAGAFDAVQPPAEIAGPWQTVGDAVQTFSDTANTVDATTPEGQQQLQAAAQEFLAVAGGPDGTAVQQFSQENCGSAAPTS